MRVECNEKNGAESVEMVRSCGKKGEGGMVKRVFRACVEENRGRGRTQRRWMDGVIELLI